MRQVIQTLEKALVPLGMVLCWHVLVKAEVIDSYVLPSPRTVLMTFVEMVRNGEYQHHLAVSVWRIAAGFLWASSLAVPLGLVVGLSKRAQRLLDPVLQFLRQIPPIAWIPLFILWLGVGEEAKLAIIIYAALFPIFINTILGISGIDWRLLEVSRILELKGFRLLREVVLPAALPSVLVGLRLGLGNSWRALVAAEMVAAASGFGYMIMAARSLVRPDEMLVGIFSIGILGLTMDTAFVKAISRLPWARDTVS